MTQRRIQLGGFDIQIVDTRADIHVLPFGHIFVDSEDKLLTPINCTPRIVRAMYASPRAVAEILNQVEHVAQTVFPAAAPDVSWSWQLDAVASCPNCCC